ncbi:hypothetical protein KQI84_17180 [bacterium]|nr:hypothetical protein [bacterium]
MNELWKFDEADGSLVINTPTPPRPWANYLTNGKHFALITQTGGGYSFFENCEHGHLTRWAPANYLADRPGRWIYIRDKATGDLWTPNFQPTQNAEDFQGRHSIVETTLQSKRNGIRASMTYTVLTEDLRREEWLVQIINESNKRRELAVYPLIFWQLGHYFSDLGTANLTALMNHGRFDRDRNAIRVSQAPWGNKPWPYEGYFASSLPIEAWEIDQELLAGPGGSWERPHGITAGKLTSPDSIMGVPMVACYQHNVELEPGEELEFTIVLGEGEPTIPPSPNEFRALLDQRRREARRYYTEDSFQIETPHEGLNQIANLWLKRQVVINNLLGRSATLYHEGGGELGYRNTAQDAWGILPMDAEFAQQRLEKLCEHQRSSGQPLPGWTPLVGPSTHEPPSDFPVWLPMLALDIVKETGDGDFLDKPLRFFDGGEAPLYEHLIRAVDFLHARARSPRGLPLMGTQDWNDAFDRVGAGGKGESVWLAMAHCFALLRLEELAAWRGDEATAKHCRQLWQETRDLVNRHAWDGDWYVIAFDDEGRPVGSRKNEEGRIHLNAQTWAIMAEIPDAEQIAKILRVIDEQLDSPLGPVMHAPAYTKYNPAVGRITAFAPGTKENAALFTHAGAFKIWADLKLGRAEQAWRTFDALLPSGPHRDLQIYRGEPHVFCEYAIGPGNPRHGEGTFTWLTGSADWLLRALLDRIIGVEPDFDSLKVAPCLPPAWRSARLRRPWRGATYEIEITSPTGSSLQIASIRIDGNRATEHRIPAFRDGRTHTIKIEME